MGSYGKIEIASLGLNLHMDSLAELRSVDLTLLPLQRETGSSKQRLFLTMRPWSM